MSKPDNLFWKKRYFQIKSIDQEGFIIASLNRQNHQGKFLWYMLILKLIFHVIGIVYIVHLFFCL